MRTDFVTTLEPRLLFATTPSIVHIGPTRGIKSLDAAPWPKKGSGANVKFVVDYSTKPYHLSHHAVFGTVDIEPADTSKRPTLELEGTNYPTLYANNKLTIRNFNTIGGYKTIIAGSTPAASVTVEKMRMLTGGTVWRGQGITTGIFRNNEVMKAPYDYVYGNFINTAKYVLIDHSGTKVPVPQGSKETAIRVMNVDHLVLKGITTKPFFKDGSIWKQDVQLRPYAKLIEVISCHFYLVDIGDMAWRQPALKVEKVVFTNCVLTKGVHKVAGCGTVIFINTKIG
jgi:hypothetical protein